MDFDTVELLQEEPTKALELTGTTLLYYNGLLVSSGGQKPSVHYDINDLDRYYFEYCRGSSWRSAPLLITFHHSRAFSPTAHTAVCNSIGPTRL